MHEETHSPASEVPKFRVFLDANVMIPLFLRQRKFQLQKLNLLHQALSAEFLTTTITQYEAAKNAAEILYKKMGVLEDSDFRDLVQDHTGYVLPAVSRGELYRRLFQEYHEMVTEITSQGPWSCLNSNDIELNRVFLLYGRKEGLFAEDSKKGQFADAVVFEQIKAIATEQAPVIIYSRDDDFKKAAEQEPNLKHVGSWPDLLRLLNVEDDIPNLQGFLDAHADEVAATCLRLIKEYETLFAVKLQGPDANETDLVPPTAKKLVRRVEVVQGPSIRTHDQVFVSGTVAMEAELPDSYTQQDAPEERGTYLGTGNLVVRCSLEVTAFLSKDEKGRHYGELELETDFGGFAVVPVTGWQGEHNLDR